MRQARLSQLSRAANRLDGRRLRGAVSVGLFVAAIATVFWACLQPPLLLQGNRPDGSAGNSSAITDSGASAILGLFTISGCADLSFPDGNPLCVGTAPLRVRLVLLSVGATMHRFQVIPASPGSDGGVKDSGVADLGVPDGAALDAGSDSLLDEAGSRAEAPELVLAVPGTYLVSLGVAGPGGTAASVGTITVEPSPLGGACMDDGQCGPGLQCLCKAADGGTTCPAGLAAGLCTQSCDGKACPAGSVCADLSRSASLPVPDGGVAAATWQKPLCVPACGGDAGCRADELCRELPLLNQGERAGGAYVWGRGCFASVPGGIGASCLGGNEKPDPGACVSGLCEPLGSRGVCSAACDVACPGSAACAVWNGAAPPAPAAPRCLARCDAMHPCSDPLLDCLPAGAAGALGFKLPGEPASTTVCAPRRCSAAADCPGGRCVALGGGSFCLR